MQTAVNKEARNSAIAFHNQAMGVVKTDPQLAYRLLASATTVDATMASGWYMMGNALADLKMLPASVAAWRRVLELPNGGLPGDMTPEMRAKSLVNFGHRLLNEGMIEEAYRVSDEALTVLMGDPSLDQEGRAFAWTNMSLVLSIMGDTDQSLELAQYAFEMSQDAIIETGLGFAYLFAGDYANGLRHFEARIPYKTPQFLNWPYPRWDGKKLRGTLLIAADQGLGDSLCMARFIPAAAALADQVIFAVQSELLRLMQAALSGWPNVSVIPQTAQFPIADVWCPVFSLPVAMGLTTGQIRDQPQVWRMPHCSGSAPKGWKDAGRSLHIGIAYAGSPGNDIDRWRSIPITQFLELYRVPGIQLYSLQVGDHVTDLHAAGCATLIRDMSPWIRDATDTVAIMRDLDMVITIESFLGHLAGAMNVESWIPLSRRGGDWRCGRSGDTPLWYPRTRLFRQGEDNAWGPVFERIVEALRERIGAG